MFTRHGARRATRAAAVVGLGIALIGGVAAATSDDPVADAQALWEQFSGPQPPIEIEALGSPPPAGKTVAMLSCGFPSCVRTSDGVRDAAEAVGWEFVSYTTEITPEAYAAAWDLILQTPPDYIAYAGLFPNSFIEDQLQRVEELGIPAVAIAASDLPEDPLIGVFIGQPLLAKSGELMGASVVADAGGAADTLFVWNPGAVLMQPVKENFEAQVLGAGGTVDVLEINSLDVGRAVPGQVVSHIQRNPGIEYVVFAISDHAAGVPEALDAAGLLQDVKILGRSPSASNLANITDGLEWVHVAEEGTAAGWRAVDAFLRHEAGLEFDPSPEGWHQIFHAGNIDDIEAQLVTPGLPDAFLAAWGVD